jgi:universal stress protein A
MYKSILLATDLRDDSADILSRAIFMQKQTGAQLSLVHVVEPLPGYSYAYLGIEDIEAQLVAEAKNILSNFAAQLNIPDERQFVVVGPIKLQILSIAATVAADLIICGSHGRHGFSLLLGSTANAILHGAICDVLTVRLTNGGHNGI